MRRTSKKAAPGHHGRRVGGSCQVGSRGGPVAPSPQTKQQEHRSGAHRDSGHSLARLKSTVGEGETLEDLSRREPRPVSSKCLGLQGGGCITGEHAGGPEACRNGGQVDIGHNNKAGG